MSRTCSTRPLCRAGGRCRSRLNLVITLAALTAVASGVAAQEAADAPVAVLGPTGRSGPAALGTQVVAAALQAESVPTLIDKLPQRPGRWPGLAFLLPRTVSEEELAALRDFRARGGVLVCLGMPDSRVAEMLGLSFAGPDEASPPVTRISCDPEQLPGAPQTIAQYPERVSSPSGLTGRAVGWYSADGVTQSGQPAVWLAEGVAATGFVPTPGDAARLGQLLLALVGAFGSDLALTAVEASVAQFGTVERYKSLGSIQSLIGGGKSAAAKRLLDAALEAHREAAAALRERDLARAMRASSDARLLLREALYANEASASVEVRAAFAAPPPVEQCQELVDLAVASGLNVVFLYWGDALSSEAMPGAGPGAPDEHPIARFLAGVGDRLDVFAWHAAFLATSGTEDHVGELRQAGRLVVAGSGETYPWLCLSNEENLAHEEALVARIAADPRIAGIVLDFVRFPAPQYCYCPECKRAFQAARPEFGTAWPPVAGQEAVAYGRFRVQQVTEALARLSAAARSARPGIVVAATAFADGEEARRSVGQDIREWMGSGAVDMLVPLVYEQQSSELPSLVRTLGLAARGRALIVPARRPMGGFALPADPLTVLGDVSAVRAARADGVALFALSPASGREIGLALGAGQFRDPAVPAYRTAMSLSLAPEPYPEVAPNTYPPSEPVELAVRLPAGLGGELQLVARSLSGTAERDLGAIGIADGTGAATVSFVPGEWRLYVRGRLQSEDGDRIIDRGGPAFRVFTPDELATAASAVERARRLDIAVYGPGAGVQTIIDELRLGLEGAVNVSMIASLDESGLRQFDVLIIQDPADPAAIGDTAVTTLRTWTRDGGRLMLLHDVAGQRGVRPVFPDLAPADERDRARVRAVRIRNRRHPAASFLSVPNSVTLANQDVAFLSPNMLDDALLEEDPPGDPEKAVVVASLYGAGRVVLSGIGFGAGAEQSGRLSRDEAALLCGLVRWLAEGCSPAY